MTDFLPGQFFDIEPTTIDMLAARLRENMETLKEQDVYEHTLYKKWHEIQGFLSKHNMASVVKGNIWTPTDLSDLDGTIAEIDALRPVIQYVDPNDRAALDQWLMLRVFVSSMRFDQNPGRVLKFLIRDEVTGKFLGLSSISSDVIAMTARDKWIGWNNESKLDKGRLKNSAIGTCIVATQPLGYNFLGGKLMAGLLVAPEVREEWKTVTGNALAGMSTTSLYGIHSMYNGIPYWKTLGETAGKIYLKPDEKIYKEFHHWIKKNHPEAYEKATVKEGIVGPVTGIKQKILDMMFRYSNLKASRYSHGFSRGVFYCPLHTNTREFLRAEIEADQLVLTPRVAKGTEEIIAWWKKKAIRRYTQLHGNGKLKSELMFYDDMLDMTWEESKDRYIGEVGR